MLIATEGPAPGLKDTESGAVICQAWTVFCSWCERQNYIMISGGLFFKKKEEESLSVCLG